MKKEKINFLEILQFENQTQTGFYNIDLNNLCLLKADAPTSTLNALMTKVLDNLQLNIKNIHIRYEEEDKSSSRGIGITIENLSAQSTNDNWEPSFSSADHKLIYKVIFLKHSFLSIFQC
jgi:hypothetical protein